MTLRRDGAPVSLRDTMDRIDPATAALPLLDEQGSPHPLAELWQRETAVVAFLRHFG